MQPQFQGRLILAPMRRRPQSYRADSKRDGAHGRREGRALLHNAKLLAQEYRALTGKPLGITGEVAEYELRGFCVEAHPGTPHRL